MAGQEFFLPPLCWRGRKQRTEDLWEVPNTIMFHEAGNRQFVQASCMSLTLIYFSFYFEKIYYVLPWVDFCIEHT